MKLAPVARALASMDGVPPVRLVVTAQHRELLDQMLAVFDLRADVDLALMRPAQTLADFGARALRELGRLFRRQPPAMVLVQGDTSTVLFGALAAFYEGVPVGHVEAGLRSFDRRQPFPEEANRTLTGRLADLHFAPTEGARANLLAEGVDPASVLVTGNTVVDSLHHMKEHLTGAPSCPGLAAILASGRPRVAITVHRRENHGEPLARIFEAFRLLAAERPDLDFVYPVHPNPNVQGPARAVLGGLPNVHLLPPLDYLDFVRLLSASCLALTDSGGVQEEAPSFGVPVVVLRECTERPEGVAAGCARLVGTDTKLIVKVSRELLARGRRRLAMKNPYGDGHAGVRVAEAVRDFLEGRS